MRFVTLALLLLLAVVHGELWFGEGGWPHSRGLQAELVAQQAVNEAARERIARLEAEVADLKTGLEIVEERARSELGMLRPDELLVQVRAPR